MRLRPVRTQLRHGGQQLGIDFDIHLRIDRVEIAAGLVLRVRRSALLPGARGVLRLHANRSERPGGRLELRTRRLLHEYLRDISGARVELESVIGNGVVISVGERLGNRFRRCLRLVRRRSPGRV